MRAGGRDYRMTNTKLASMNNKQYRQDLSMSIMVHSLCICFSFEGEESGVANMYTLNCTTR